MTTVDLKSRIEKELLEGLNEVQKQAVLHESGPLLIIAGAGSGKTRVITHHVAYQARIRETAPWNIAAVTFTNKAAQEMRERMGHLMGPMADDVFVRTFHSLGLYVMTRQADQIPGLKSNFSIYDSQAQQSLLKQILKDFKMEGDYLNPRSMADAINRARDGLIPPEQFEPTGFFAEEQQQVYGEYIKRLRENNAIDFGDLLYETARLLQRSPETLAYYRNRWKHFLIDEYQDTNYAQYVLGRLIAQEHQNIIVVGDDDQSIYSWRGADVSNILNFEKDYPNCKVLKLEENYRSTEIILKAASSLIARNDRRLDKTLFTSQAGGELVHYQEYETDLQEVSALVERVRSHKNRGRKFSDIAVFYRTNAQSRIIEQALRTESIPFVLIGGFRFYDRKEIKDLMSYLAVVVNPADTQSLLRIINTPLRGVGDTGLKRLEDFALEQGISLHDAMARVGEIPKLRCGPKVGKLGELFADWREMRERGVLPSQIAEDVLNRSGYLEMLKKENSPEARSRLDNLYEFISSVVEYEEQAAENDEQPTLTDYLQKISLYTSESNPDMDGDAEDDDYLQLMTLHNAKGLEFPVVLIVGMEDGYIPHSFSRDEGNLDEERRLMYVGITRAREELYLSGCSRRRIFGSFQQRIPSPFLGEIDPEALNADMSRRNSRTAAYTPRAFQGVGGPGAVDSSLKRNRGSAGDSAAASIVFDEGDRVHHDKYGEGTISFAENTVAGQKISVAFDGEERERTFLTQYTPMRKLN